MNTTIQKYKEKYPRLFSTDGSKDSFSLFGIECDSGWLTIIDNVFRLLYRRYNNCKESLSWWQQHLNELQNENTAVTDEVVERINKAKTLVEQYSSELKLEEEKIPVILQIKEKWGTLRIYTSRCDEYVQGVIDMAELLSATTCECCGSSGKLYRQGWHRTLCTQHALEKNKINLADN